MTVLNVTNARKQLYRLVETLADTHEPVIISGRNHNAVLLSEEDWRSVQETLYLLSIPGMRESLRQGMAEPLEECSSELDW